MQTLAKIVIDIWSLSTDKNTIIYAYKGGNNIAHITSKDVNTMLKIGARSMKLETRGYPISRISPHSLHSGGAMALKLGGMDIITIKKYGRWASDTFLRYIHEQLSALGHNVSKVIAKPHNFYNVAGFTNINLIKQNINLHSIIVTSLPHCS